MPITCPGRQESLVKTAVKQTEIAAGREDCMAKREWASALPRTELPATRLRAALDAGHGIAVLALTELVDPTDAARLVGGDRIAAHLVHLHVARTVSGVDWPPSSLPDDPDADVMRPTHTDGARSGRTAPARPSSSASSRGPAPR
ncbi:hypothetical protein [Streptomyces sp. 900105755]